MHKIMPLTLLMALWLFSPAAFAQTIGTVSALEGVAIITHPDRQSALKIGSNIEMNDRIIVQDQSSLTIEFADNTALALGAGTQLVIDEYVYDPNDSKAGKAEFSILKGPFHYVSGLMAKTEKPDVTINLDFGSIGIRGTKIWRDMTMTEDGKPQCRIYLEDGSARVSNGRGFTTLKHGDGTNIVGTNVPPTSSKPWGEAAIADIKSKSPIIDVPEQVIEPEPIVEPEPTPGAEPVPEPEPAPAPEPE